MYTIVDSTTKKISKNYAVIDNVTRKINKIYGVVDGTTRLIWSEDAIVVPKWTGVVIVFDTGSLYTKTRTSGTSILSAAIYSYNCSGDDLFVSEDGNYCLVSQNYSLHLFQYNGTTYDLTARAVLRAYNGCYLSSDGSVIYIPTYANVDRGRIDFYKNNITSVEMITSSYVHDYPEAYNDSYKMNLSCMDIDRKRKYVAYNTKYVNENDDTYTIKRIGISKINSDLSITELFSSDVVDNGNYLGVNSMSPRAHISPDGKYALLGESYHTSDEYYWRQAMYYILNDTVTKIPYNLHYNDSRLQEGGTPFTTSDGANIYINMCQGSDAYTNYISCYSSNQSIITYLGIIYLGSNSYGNLKDLFTDDIHAIIDSNSDGSDGYITDQKYNTYIVTLSKTSTGQITSFLFDKNVGAGEGSACVLVDREY